MKNYFFTFISLFLTFNAFANSKTEINNMTADKMTASVYIVHGPATIPDEKNKGFMNNPGIIMTSKGVVVIDPGGTIEGAEMVLRVIKKMTDQPVVAVFNTHVHADHWFGNAAFTRAYPGIPVYAHQVTLDESTSTGHTWVQTLKTLTKTDQHDADFVIANKTISDGDVITIGNTTFTSYHYPVTHSHSDMMIAVNGNEALFMGDNLYNGRLNQHADGHIKKTMTHTAEVVAKVNPTILVPGHGKSGSVEMFEHSLNLYKILYSTVHKLYQDDLSDFEMKPDVSKALAGYKHWEEFDNLLGKAINKAFLEIEEADF